MIATLGAFPAAQDREEPVKLFGTLSTFTIPGIMQTWPTVAGVIIAGSSQPEGARLFSQAWNSGELLLGSLLELEGWNGTVHGLPGFLPQSFRVLSQGTEPVTDPWAVELPTKSVTQIVKENQERLAAEANQEPTFAEFGGKVGFLVLALLLATFFFGKRSS